MPTKRRKNGAGVIVASFGDEIYYQVETVIDMRVKSGGAGGGRHPEYLVRWKGYSETTWEPARNLCDSALEEAHRKFDFEKFPLYAKGGKSGASSSGKCTTSTAQAKATSKSTRGASGVDGATAKDEKVRGESQKATDRAVSPQLTLSRSSPGGESSERKPKQKQTKKVRVSDTALDAATGNSSQSTSRNRKANKGKSGNDGGDDESIASKRSTKSTLDRKKRSARHDTHDDISVLSARSQRSRARDARDADSTPDDASIISSRSFRSRDALANEDTATGKSSQLECRSRVANKRKTGDEGGDDGSIASKSAKRSSLSRKKRVIRDDTPDDASVISARSLRSRARDIRDADSAPDNASIVSSRSLRVRARSRDTSIQENAPTLNSSRLKTENREVNKGKAGNMGSSARRGRKATPASTPAPPRTKTQKTKSENSQCATKQIKSTPSDSGSSNSSIISRPPRSLRSKDASMASDSSKGVKPAKVGSVKNRKARQAKTDPAHAAVENEKRIHVNPKADSTSENKGGKQKAPRMGASSSGRSLKVGARQHKRLIECDDSTIETNGTNESQQGKRKRRKNEVPLPLGNTESAKKDAPIPVDKPPSSVASSNTGLAQLEPSKTKAKPRGSGRQVACFEHSVVSSATEKKAAGVRKPAGARLSNVAEPGRPVRSSRLNRAYATNPGTQSNHLNGGQETINQDPWSWTDEEQLYFRVVERISVHDPSARKRVTDARQNGIPIVLTRHVGWANFAKDWLDAIMEAGERTEDCRGNRWLDLSRSHVLNISRMEDEIGQEDVPIVRKNYNETNPIHSFVKASDFLMNHWHEKKSSSGTTSDPQRDELLYLHQWQFPLSGTAGTRLCHQSNPLPNFILGEDLLKYWLDLPQCKMDNPLQYLFMGREQTMSKLHCDHGGLDISIAPIIGEKECILVHRSDGSNCFYDLDASLDDVNLNKFPLMAKARIWKTVVKPGEILLMPNGTYHQCRNVTPCLSYSRFHLDDVNLLPFYQSMIDGDLKDIDHGEILWNATNELIEKLDTFSASSWNHVTSQPADDSLCLRQDTIELVKTLRSLRNIGREISRRPAAKVGIAKAKTPSGGTKVGMATNWKRLVSDIDDCLHHFRYRHSREIPPMPSVRKKANAGKNGIASLVTYEDESVTESVCTNVDQAFRQLPQASLFLSGDKLPSSGRILVSDHLIARICGKQVLGTVMAVETSMKAAFLKYDGYPAVYDEWQPFDRIKNTRRDAAGILPGTAVSNRWGESGDEYRAVVVRVSCERFYSVRLQLSASCHIDRWCPFEMVVGMANLRGPHLD